MDLGLRGRVALVAAASQGLGAAVALEFAREGARLVICSRSQERIEARAAAIRAETGAEALAIQCDVRDQQDVDSMMDAAIERFGAIDILITNAGGPPPAPIVELEPADYENAFQLNMMSTVRLCYAALPHMLRLGSGSIVTITSLSVKQPIDNLALSNSIRLAVIGLTKSMANELGPQGIRVNSILPGWTRTSRVSQLLESRASANGTTGEIEANKIARSFPLRRLAEPAEFARVTVFLASPAASYVHGVALPVDGGACQATL